MKEHKLKIYPEYFEAVRSKQKTFEIRKNDRDYQVGDSLILQEFDPNIEAYTDESVSASVTYIFYGGSFGVDKGYVVMAIQVL